MTANPIQPIEDISSVIDSNLRIFPTFIQIFLKHLIISEVKQKVLVMQLHEHPHQDQ